MPTAVFTQRRQRDSLEAEERRQRAALDAESERLERRLTHERELKWADDLVSRFDDVQVALERLGETCAEMRQSILLGVINWERVNPLLELAEDAYQEARALIARLGMRPIADPDVVAKAREAAGFMMEAIRVVRHARFVSIAPKSIGYDTVEAKAALVQVPDSIERGYRSTETYERLARDAVGKLLGRPAGIDE